VANNANSILGTKLLQINRSIQQDEIIQMPLNLALRAAAIIIIVAAGIDFLINSDLRIQPVIVANVLFLLSFFASYDSRRIGIITLLLCAVLMFGAIKFYLDGAYTLPWAVLEFVVFGFLGGSAWGGVRSPNRPG
jgi:hypothetical protein